MATGRIDVSRVRGVHGGGLSSGRVRDAHCVGWKRGAHVVAEDFEDGEILQVDGEFQLPPEKKRKYSPIIWDKEEKKGELLKDGLAKASLPCLPDWGLVKESVVEGCGAALESPVVFASSDQASQGSVVDEEQGPEGEELVEPRNVYMSRWAFDEDDVPGDTEEVLHGSGSRSMESDCRDSSVSFSSADETSESKLDSQASMADDEHNVSTGFPHRSVGMCQGCRSVFEYERLDEIGEGTYGKVYRARDKKTGEIVALKKVKISANLEKYDTPLTALREINILSSLYHPNIVNIKEVVMDDLDSVFIVMECMDNDLKGVMEVMKQPFHTSDVKWLMRQILKGVKHLHNNWVLHRDLKTSNILLNNNGELKLCDFGMSRRYGDPLKPYTPLVVTLWYRAPELLLSAKKYSTAVDMWSVGCIMAELLAKKPLFAGKNEIDQLDKIFRLLGTPNEETWPGFAALPGAKAKFDRKPYLLDKMFSVPSFTGKPVLSGLGLDLLNKLLAYDSEKRITADDALNHPWFHEEPKAKKFLPTFPPQSARARIRHATKRNWILRHAWLRVLRQMCTIFRYYLFNLVKQIGADWGTKILVMILSSLCRRF